MSKFVLKIKYSSIPFIIFTLSFLSVFGQINFGFWYNRSYNNNFGCLDRIELRAYDSLTAGAYIKPGFDITIQPQFEWQSSDGYLYVNYRASQNGNPVRFYFNHFTDTLKHYRKNFLRLMGEYFQPPLYYSIDIFCNSDSGKYLITIMDHADKHLIYNQLISFNGIRSQTIEIGNLLGIANFKLISPNSNSEILETDINGIGWFYPAKAGPGNYKIEYSWNNQKGFQQSITQDLIIEPPLIELLSQPAYCKDATVSIGNLVRVIRGTGKFNYLWTSVFPAPAVDNPQFRYPIVKVNNTSTYNFKVSDDITISQGETNKCYSEKQITITVNKPPEISKIDTLPISCNNGADGKIVFTLTGGTGTPPYTYLAKASNNSFYQIDKLPADTYRAIVRDAAGCSDTTFTSLSNPPAILINSVSKKDITICYGDSAGTITIQAFGGTGALFYSIDGGKTFSDKPDFTKLKAGKYPISVKDSRECIKIGETIEIKQPEDIIIDKINSTNVLPCFGDKTGKIEINARWGSTIDSLFYSIDSGLNFSKNAIFDNLQSSNYQIFIKNTRGCINKGDLINISQPSLLKFDSVRWKNVAPCFENETGQISIYASGGKASYSFSIDSGKTFFLNKNIFTNLKSGNYQPVVKDGNNCVRLYSQPVSIKQPDILILEKVNNQNITTCYGDKTGEIEIIAKGGTKPLSYSIDKGISFYNKNKFNQLSAGNYGVIVKDTLNCQTKIVEVKLTEPPKFFVKYLEYKDIDSCFGDSTGYIRLSHQGGTEPVLFTIDQKIYSKDSVFNKLIAGQYHIQLKDANGCPSKDSILTIKQPEKIIIDKIDITHILRCYGDKTGLIKITANGGTKGLFYSIDGAKSFTGQNIFSNLPSNQYVVFVRDANKCMASGGLVYLKQPQKLEIKLLGISNIHSCYGDSTGKIEIKVSGGTGSIYYSISINQPEDSLTNVFYKLHAGKKYLPQVRDSMGCSDKGDTIILTQPQRLILDSTVIQNVLSCAGNSEGQISIFESGGTGPMQYSIDNGINYFNDSTFNKLKAGNYKIAVQDLKGCITTDSVIITEPPVLKIESIIKTDITSYHNDNSGKIEIIRATGGTGNLSFSVNKGVKYTDNKTFDKLFAGQYIIKARDANLCETAGDTIFITEPADIPYTITKEEIKTCYGNKEGKIILLVSDISSMAKFSIDNGRTFQDSATFSHLPSGPYRIFMVDSTKNARVMTDTIYIIEPELFLIDSIFQQNMNTCFGDSTGLIKIKPKGGTPPYYFSIDNGFNFQNDSMFSNLKSSTYLVLLKDDKACLTENESVTITHPPKLQIKSADHLDIENCFGDSTAWIRIFHKGGTSPVYFKLNNDKFLTDSVFNNLKAGEYIVLMKDVNNCLSNDSTITIQQPDELQIINIKAQDNTCFDSHDGWISAHGNGGTGNLKYSLSGDSLITYQDSGSFKNLKPGNYQVNVSDSNNCETFEDIIINSPPRLSDNLDVKPTTCDIAKDGIINANGSGGVPPYKYTLNDSLSVDISTFKSLAPGLYKIKLRDSKECVANDTIRVEITDKFCLEIFTVFTPNGDGKNDTWEIKNIDLYPMATIQIFDSWGKLLTNYKSDDRGWDGRYNNKQMPMDTYWYLINLNDGVTKVFTGYFTLIR